MGCRERTGYPTDSQDAGLCASEGKKKRAIISGHAAVAGLDRYWTQLPPLDAANFVEPLLLLELLPCVFGYNGHSACDTVIYKKKYIFGFVSCSWHRAPKTHGIS